MPLGWFLLTMSVFGACRRWCGPWWGALGLLAAVCCLGLAGCGADDIRIAAAVAPLPGEDVARPCVFEIALAPVAAQRGLLVVYQRGDSAAFYEDAEVRATAAELGYAMVWAHECDARSTGDLQPLASEGPARMLPAALVQLAHATGHPELTTAKMILFGFSAGGVLTATMANGYPERLLGTVQYAAGSAYVDLDDVRVTAAGAALPTLILANGEDDAAGTSRSFRYFQRGRARGAVWAYGVQPGVGHCCTLSTRAVVLPWIKAVAAGSDGAGVRSYFVCSPDGVTDDQGETDCSFSAASLVRGAGLPREQNGWLPDSTTAAAWLQWVSVPTADGDDDDEPKSRAALRR